MPLSHQEDSHGATLLQRVSVSATLLVLSISLLALRAVTGYLKRTRKSNGKRRRLLIEKLGLPAEKNRERLYTIVGFFHPYCNAGGGGERVLFEAIRYHLSEDQRKQDKEVICVVYAGDVNHSESLTGQSRSTRRKSASIGGTALPSESSSIADGGGMASKEEILRKVSDRFDIPLHEERYSSHIAFLPLQSRGLVADKYWKRLTMLGQSFGGMVLAKEACEELIPDIFIDTMGYAFSFPVVRMFASSIKIGAYIHYPTISNDMINRISRRESTHTNDDQIARSRFKSHIKLVYYKTFKQIYSWSLKRADVLVVNGSWTQNHINSLLNRRQNLAQVVYPPCDVSQFSSLSVSRPRTKTLISLAQFRPEKEHATQIKVLAKIFELRPDLKKASGEHEVKLVMMGSCRNAGDEERIEQLKSLCKKLDVEAHTSFIVNAPFPEIVSNLSTSSIGLSTMIDEHFGINVVEFMASGLITLSHASAGPLLDIAVPDEKTGKITGYHAHSIQEFAEKAIEILDLNQDQQQEIRNRARIRALNVFSREAFWESWQQWLWRPLCQ
ncbi:unnamed protein product [Sympodiomycopsis kandeliae]